MEDAARRDGIPGPRSHRPSKTLSVPPVLLAPLLEDLSDKRRIQVPRRGTLYRQGDEATTIFVVIRGRVSISVLHEDGHESTLDIVGAGALCGESAAFDRLPHFSTASALEDSDVLTVPVEVFRRLMHERVDFFQSVLSVLALKQRTLASRLAQVAQPTAEARITQLLTEMTRGHEPAVNLTHQQIANLIGSSRVTVTRAVQRLRRCGSIHYEDGMYRLP